MIYLMMFWEFFKAGLFAIGGGLATLPYLYDIADRYDWLDSSKIPDMVAIAESTPGPIGINIATFAGFNAGGLLGGMVTTLGIIAPSIIISTLIFKFLDKYSDNIYVNRALKGIRPASAALIASAGASIVLISVFNTALYSETGAVSDLFNVTSLIVFAALLLGTFKLKKLHPIIFIAAAAIIGILFKL